MPLKDFPLIERSRLVADFNGIRENVRATGFRMVKTPTGPKDPEQALLELEARGDLKINFTRRGYAVVWALSLEPELGYLLVYRQRGGTARPPRAEGHWGYRIIPPKGP